jgi:hypothetical protein
MLKKSGRSKYRWVFDNQYIDRTVFCRFPWLDGKRIRTTAKKIL